MLNSLNREVYTSHLTGIVDLYIYGESNCSHLQTWNCLILRFPLLNGIKLPEDELVEIRCRPHDATADDNAILSVATAKYADKNQM